MTTLVTGAASGLGRATALRMAERSPVALLDVNVEGARRVAEEITAQGGAARAYHCDVAVAADVRRAIGEAERALGPVDALFNNAGVSKRTPVEEITVVEWDLMMNVHARGMFLVAQTALHGMVARKKGAIVNTSSDFAVIGVSNAGAYCAAKSAIYSLTKALALEFAPFNIRVNAVGPGPDRHAHHAREPQPRGLRARGRGQRGADADGQARPARGGRRRRRFSVERPRGLHDWPACSAERRRGDVVRREVMRRRRFLMMAGASAASVSLSRVSRAQTAIPLKVGVLKQAALTDGWVAQQAGIYDKHGLKVELIEFRNGNEAIAAQRGGYVDVALAIPGSAMLAMERGFDLVLIAQNETAKAAPPDSGSMQVLADSAIKSVGDLAGKTIAVGNLNSQMHVAVMAVLQKSGVDPKSAQYLEIPFSSHFDVLRTKQIDVVATLDPWTTQMLNSGKTRVIGWQYVDSVPEQPIGCWFATGPFVSKNRDAVVRFGEAIRDAIDHMRADETRARKYVADYTGLNIDLIQNMPLNNWDYRINPTRWQQTIDMMHIYGGLQKEHQARQYFSDFLKPYITD